ncbi:hypothetical protein CHH26_11610 [Qipengyuania flava]|uniref:hypothetical protein n=1 Tax=Qipengyuania flava TaxID=192812 RepID=UPI000B8BB7B2|nr:hypothetical protein [Qipengyuania flava]ASP30803.1 hypothetical protein CHH26_11610 [Qipengyuania flava]
MPAGLGGSERQEALGATPEGEKTAPQPLSGGPIQMAERWAAALQNVGNTFGGVAGTIADLAASIINPAMQSSIDKAAQLQNSLQGLTSVLQKVFGKKLGGILGAGLQIFSAFAGGGKVPGFANGTNYAPGGLAMVGERGPELVNLPRGSQVFTNRESMGMMGGKLQIEVVANNDGFGAFVRNQAGEVVAQAAPSIMTGASQMAQVGMQRRASRALAPGGRIG